MPNQVLVRGSSSIEAVAYGSGDLRINFCSSTKMWSEVRRSLAKYDYQPDLEERAEEIVLQQAELFASRELE